MGGQLAFPGSVRASDSDRERAAALLRRHYTAGRLTLAELESRTARAYGATLRSDLRALVRDMPFDVDRSGMSRRIDRFQRGLLRIHVGAYTAFNTVLVSIWAWGGGHEFWPALSLVPGGALLLWHRTKSRAATRRLSRPSAQASWRRA
jgi:hypothetical protein